MLFRFLVVCTIAQSFNFFVQVQVFLFARVFIGLLKIWLWALFKHRSKSCFLYFVKFLTFDQLRFFLFKSLLNFFFRNSSFFFNNWGKVFLFRCTDRTIRNLILTWFSWQFLLKLNEIFRIFNKLNSFWAFIIRFLSDFLAAFANVFY